MRPVSRVKVAHRQLSDHDLRANLADHDADVVSKIQVRNDRAVHVPEKAKVGYTDLRCGIGLFTTTDMRHCVTFDRAVEPTGLTIGHEAVDDLDSGVS